MHVLLVLATIVVFLVALRSGWVGDVLGLALPVILLASLVVASVLVVVRRAWCTVPLTAFVVSAFLVVTPRLPERTPAPVAPLRFAAVNLKFDSHDAATGARDAVAIGADVLVVSELTSTTDRMLEPEFPYRIVNRDLADGSLGEGVYSKVPLTRLDMPTGVLSTGLRVAIGGTAPFVLYALHLPRPTFAEPHSASMISFAGQREAVFALDAAADIDAETGPVVIAGDLNLSDRTSGYRRLADGRVDASRSAWAGSTFHGSLTWSLLLLRIDHIFIPARWCASGSRTFDLGGSDHRGVTALIGHCP